MCATNINDNTQKRNGSIVLKGQEGQQNVIYMF